MTAQASAGGRPTVAEIDLSAVRANFRAIRSLAPQGEFVCPMVKANAYGHGDVECARALRAEGAEHLGVALFEEAARLRAAGDTGSLLVFGPFSSGAIESALRDGATPVIGSLAQLREFARAAKKIAPLLGRPISFHLEFDTGMCRLGLMPDDASAARDEIDACGAAAKLEGVCTHFRSGEDAGEEGGVSAGQVVEFRRALAAFRGRSFRAHLCNSSAAVNLAARAKAGVLDPGAIWPAGVRPGIALYGAKPPTSAEADVGLLPAMTFKTKIVELRRASPGARVSYGGRWQARRPSLIGVLPAGYADGYLRALSNKGAALVKGLRAPIAGTVCMDYSMIDLTDVERQAGAVAIGDDAILFGRGPNGQAIAAQELADAVGTIPYEIFTSVSARVPRVYLRSSGNPDDCLGGGSGGGPR